MTPVRELRQTVERRNALLQRGACDHDTYMIWTEQLFNRSRVVQHKRRQLLAYIEQTINTILKENFKEDLSVQFRYIEKKSELMNDFESFLANNERLRESELRYRRSLFGAHLDDFVIDFQTKQSKKFSSRGQQKLVVLLTKIAQINYLNQTSGPAIFLLDDFMTDFDDDRAGQLLTILRSMPHQLIFTTPTHEGFFQDQLKQSGAQQIKLLN